MQNTILNQIKRASIFVQSFSLQMMKLYLNCLSIRGCNYISWPHTSSTDHILASCNNEMDLHNKISAESKGHLNFKNNIHVIANKWLEKKDEKKLTF